MRLNSSAFPSLPFPHPPRPLALYPGMLCLGPSLSMIANTLILLLYPLRNAFSPSHACGFHFHYTSNLFALSFVSSWKHCTSIILVPLVLFPGRECL